MLLKSGTVLYQCLWRLLISILCLVMHVLCVYALKRLSGFFGTWSGFFGEDSLATLTMTTITHWSNLAGGIQSSSALGIGRPLHAPVTEFSHGSNGPKLNSVFSTISLLAISLEQLFVGLQMHHMSWRVTWTQNCAEIKLIKSSAFFVICFCWWQNVWKNDVLVSQM